MNVEKKIIRNILESLNEKVVSKKQLINAFRDVLQDKYSENILVQLRKNKDILYVFKGYYYIVNPNEQKGSFTTYSISEMVYVILNKLNIKWYLGLESALERNKLIWQSVVSPVIINSDFSGKRSILGVNFQFHKMKREKLAFGYIKNRTKNRITFYYSTPEKTYLDYLYFNKKPPSELSNVDSVQLKSFLKKYSKNFKKKVLYT